MAPNLEIGDNVTLAFKTSDDEWKEITGTIGIDTNDHSLDAISYVINDFQERSIYVNSLKKGDKIMENKVLNLWYKKEYEKIIDEYEKKEQEYVTNNELAKQYNELVNNFEIEMKALYESVDNQMTQYIEEKTDSSIYQYGINHEQLRNEFVEKFIKERNEKIKELKDLNEEIEAQLSLSNDLEYQLEVLTRYGIIDKKTKKMVD